VALSVGLIGAGAIGELRARALARGGDCALAAVADPDLGRAARVARAAGARVYPGHRELLDREKVDAVIVSTPPPLHEPIALDALEAGKHVLCEKPLSNRPESARRIVERARRAGLVLATGFNHRYFPPVRRLRRAIESGEIGELAHVRAFAGHPGLAELGKPWLTDPEVMGGGALMDNGIHLLDLTRHLLGEVREVVGLRSEAVWRIRGCEDTGVALLRSKEGRIATLHASWTEWRGYRFWLAATGSRGAAWAYYPPMAAMVLALDRPGGSARRRLELFPRQNLAERLRSWRWTVVSTFAEEHRDFRVLIGGGSGTIAEGFDGFRAVEMAHAVYRSSSEGRSIELCDPF
jgi:predicted dehydrogenase